MANASSPLSLLSGAQPCKVDNTHLFNGPLSRTTWVSRYQVGKISLNFTEARDAVASAAPRSREITTPAPYHSVFYRPDALPAAQPTASKHWRVRQIIITIIIGAVWHIEPISCS